MQIDATKIILALIVILQSLIAYIGMDILNRIDRVEGQIQASIKAGAFDMVADYFTDKDSLSVSDQELLEHILLESK